MAELQLPGFLPNLIHGEVHNPAEFIAFLVHVALTGRTQHFPHHTGGFLGLSQLSGGQEYQRARLELQGLCKFFPHSRVSINKLGNAACNGSLLVHFEPVGLLTGLHLHLGAELIYGLPGQGTAGDGHSLCYASLEGRKVDAGEQLRHVLHL